jgi:hypothetical protein
MGWRYAGAHAQERHGGTILPAVASGQLLAQMPQSCLVCGGVSHFLRLVYLLKMKSVTRIDILTIPLCVTISSARRQI